METLWKKIHSRQMSEAFLTAVFLSLSGGLQDAYTYLCRGEVFANAQTGNIVLFSVSLLDRDWVKALHYLIPLLFFALGVFIAEKIREKYHMVQKFHWRQVIILFEMVLLFVVGLLPSKMDILANALVSFSCAMQVQSFRKVDGFAYASTMCIGNLRSGVESLCTWRRTGDPQSAQKTKRYFGIILLFTVGAGMGGYFVNRLGYRAVWGSCILLFVCFVLMFIKEDLKEGAAPSNH